MFEKFSGFFKRFTRRQKKQSGETTIMDAREPGLDEMALDESFGDLSDLEQSIDKIGTEPLGTDEQAGVGASFPDADLGTDEMDFSTGGTDFDEQTISDEVSAGGRTSAEFEDVMPQAEAPGVFGEEGAEMPFGGPIGEPEPAAPGKRILVIAGALVLALVVGGAFQMFAWPYVGKMIGMAGVKEPTVDVETQLTNAKRDNTKLKTEMSEFKTIGSPAEVKTLQQDIAQARDSQGPLEDLEKRFNDAKEKETAYEGLVKRISDLQSQIADARSDINKVTSRIEDARQKVIALKKQTELEYARFQNELVRAEVGQRTLIELQQRDNKKFQKQLQDLEDYLSRLSSQQAPAAPSEGTAAADTGAES